MSAGLPGVGLGGLFFIISALVMPIFEFRRHLAGRSSRERWTAVWRQFAIALGMIAAAAAAYASFDALAHAVHAQAHVVAIPLISVLCTLAILAVVTGGAKAAQALAARRAAPSRPLVAQLDSGQAVEVFAGAARGGRLFLTLARQLCTGVFVMYAFFATFAALNPRRAIVSSTTVAALAAFWLLTLPRRLRGDPDVMARRNRERRGF
jgi:hypothetical protein